MKKNNKKNIVSDKIQFKINDASKMLNISSATIRNWEKKGFIKSSRRANKYRVFDEEDLKLLKLIKEWSVDKKMGSVAIKEMLETHYNTVTDKKSKATNISRAKLNNKWKETRIAQNKTLKDVSKDTGISISQLSKIENTKTNSSIDALQKLADYYGDNILYYLPKSETKSCNIVKKNERNTIKNALKGVVIEDLVALEGIKTSCMLYTIEANAKRNHKTSHPGIEIVYVLKGELSFFINEKQYDLKEGDCLSYKSTENHHWINNSNHTSQVLWIFERN